MRAAHISRALAKRFEVHLAVLSESAAGEGVDDWFTSAEALPAIVDTHYQLVRRIADPILRLRALRAYPRPADCRLISGAAVDRVAGLAAEMDRVHVMRLYLAPLTERIPPDAGLWRSLDCDDDDSAYHRMRGLLLDEHGAADAAAFERAEAAKYDALKQAWLPRFDRVFTAAPGDLDGMTGAHAAACLPNIADDHCARTPAPPSDALRLLFVGNLAYPPNLDAVRWLSDALLPALDHVWDRPVRMDIVGDGLPEPTSADPRVRFHGRIENLDLFYDDCDVALVPLRFGSGVPLKLLEAFSRQVPVVASRHASVAAGAASEQHCLVADAPNEVAKACVRLKTDLRLAERLSAQAADQVRRRHSPRALDEAVAAQFSG